MSAEEPSIRQRIDRADKFRVTVHELHILQGFADGLVAHEIASELNIKPTTVHNQTAILRLKLRALTTPEAVAIGFREGFLK